MDVELGLQARALLLALLMGAGLGVLYDALRPLRRRTGRVAGGLLDALFCAAAGAAAFVYAMGADNGRLGLWELSAALIGFLIYMHTLSAAVLGVFTALLDLLCRAAVLCKKAALRLHASAKKRVARVRQWLGALKARLKRKKPPGEETCREM